MLIQYFKGIKTKVSARENFRKHSLHRQLQMLNYIGGSKQGRSQKKIRGGGYGAEGARIEAYKMFHANLFHKKKFFAKISGGFEPVNPPPLNTAMDLKSEI
jgi:hypothetical protein